MHTSGPHFSVLILEYLTLDYAASIMFFSCIFFSHKICTHQYSTCAYLSFKGIFSTTLPSPNSSWFTYCWPDSFNWNTRKNVLTVFIDLTATISKKVTAPKSRMRLWIGTLGMFTLTGNSEFQSTWISTSLVGTWRSSLSSGSSSVSKASLVMPGSLMMPF